MLYSTNKPPVVHAQAATGDQNVNTLNSTHKSLDSSNMLY
jgi:hypothetical protein